MSNKRKNNWAGGIILISIGLLALLGQLVNWQLSPDFGVYLLSVLGALFLVWGIITRQAGPMIPGGILSGLGLGVVLVETMSWPQGMDEGGVFLLAFALGWVLITVLTAVFTSKTHWWPLIPGGIIAVVGLAVLFGGVFWQALNLLNLVWPLLLIILGITIIFNARRPKEKSLKA
ncbi:MAG: hypothetical protein H6659_09920 [Ardenticatenaceae bacterium]|nr:hypothetical protein [Ardenticatenaceae bacterium]MCB8987731.1 hypothetical protein [Ardenticatenaceae bacterium]